MRAGGTTRTSKSFWDGMGLRGLRLGLERERDRSASEPTARYAPAVLHARPTEPEESDSLLWALSGGLSPPPALGAGAARTIASRCACPPLPPPALLTHPHPAAPRARGCLTRFCARHSSLSSRFSEPENTATTLKRRSSSSTTLSAGGWAVSPACGRHCVCRAIGSCVRVVARVHCRHRFCACGAANACEHDCFKCCRCSVVL